MIPRRLVGKHDFRAYVTFFILFIYVSFFFWEIFLTSTGGNDIEYYLPQYALAVCEVGEAPWGEVLVDSLRAMFMSTSFVQIFVNVLFLWVFAPLVEQFLGGRRFLFLFFLAGLMSYVFGVVLTPATECEVMYGPNGAIAGLMAAFIFLYPTRRIETYFPVIDRAYDIPGIMLALVYLSVQFLSEGGALSGEVLPIWDEIGGFIVGLVFIFVVTLFKPAPRRDPLD